MRKRLTKDQVLTIPNAMSLFRLLLVPIILWVYMQGRSILAVILTGVSAVTDMLDGFIARKFNMTSDVGKVLDPLADKFTQLILLICMTITYPRAIYLIMLLVVKELVQLGVGAMMFHHSDQVTSSQWYGKLSTAVFEGTMIILMLFENIPHEVGYTMMSVCAALLIFSLVRYLLMFMQSIKNHKKA